MSSNPEEENNKSKDAPETIFSPAVTEKAKEVLGKRNLWLRLPLMVLMGLAMEIVKIMTWVLAPIQLVLALFTDGPHKGVQKFGRGLGLYMHHLVDYLTFVRDDVPFPFSDWPDTDKDFVDSDRKDD